MARFLFILLFSLFVTISYSQIKTIHIFVALCDNEHQGIVPVPSGIGNGQDPRTNLYWGCGYGVKTYFDKYSDNWTLIKTWKNVNSIVLERILFKHKSQNVYLLADAYDGAHMQETMIVMLQASSGHKVEKVSYEGIDLSFGGGANLIGFIGHNGLMDSDINESFTPADSLKRETIILACYSKSYFSEYIKQTGAYPLLWSTHLMAPEAYTIKWAIDFWILGKSNDEIKERAAQAYNKYQKCGINGARKLLVTGW